MARRARGGTWRAGAGPGAHRAGAAQGLAKVTAACGSDGPTKSPAAAAGEALSPPVAEGTRPRRPLGALRPTPREKRGWSRVKGGELSQGLACSRRCAHDRACALPVLPEIYIWPQCEIKVETRTYLYVAVTMLIHSLVVPTEGNLF